MILPHLSSKPRHVDYSVSSPALWPCDAQTGVNLPVRFPALSVLLLSVGHQISRTVQHPLIQSLRSAFSRNTTVCDGNRSFNDRV